MNRLMRWREAERRLLKELERAEYRWIRYGGRWDARAVDDTEKLLVHVRGWIRALVGPVEHEGGVLVRYRRRAGGMIGVCPFCGGRHRHPPGDGRGRCPGDSTVVADDGTVLRQEDGYILRVRRAAKLMVEVV
jgi:hypothetical protein